MMDGKISYRRNIFFVLALAVIFFVVGSGNAEAAVKLFYYRDNANAQASLLKNVKYIDVLAPQSYSIDVSGVLSGSINSMVTDITKKNNIKIMPLVTNKAFSETAAETILDNPSEQDTIAAALISEAQNKGFWGWQVDFEGMNASYRNEYSAFINRVGIAMKKAGLEFSVAVVAQISSNPGDYPKNLWNRIIGAYDYGSLANSVDFVSVMSYDDPNSGGPVTPFPWLQGIIKFSLQNMPASKLSIGLPLYYWKWDDTTGKLVDIGGNAGIQNTLKRPHITMGYDKLTQAPFIKYKVNKVPYTLWYENGTSLTQKINLIKKDHLYGFSAWALGLEVPSAYNALQIGI